MYYPSKKEFIKLAKKGNVIPVYSEMLDDFGTPLSVFLAVDEGDFSYLLESVEGGEHMARFSFLGSAPSLTIESRGDTISITEGTKKKTYKTKTNPIDEIKKLMDKFRFVPVDGLPRFCGGLVGYMGYDMVRHIENVPDMNPADFDIADMQFVLTDTILILDHVEHRIKIVSNAVIKGDPAIAYDKACREIDKIIKKLKNFKVNLTETKKQVKKSRLKSNFSKEKFCEIVKKAKSYIRAGEVIQLVLSQRIERKTKVEPFSIYRALRSINPSPYMYYLKFGGYKIIGSSPEILVRCENRVVEVRPIAGTRPRGRGEKEDAKFEKELLADPKEKAEHIMLVDLGRNDIGRVCEYSTVKVKELMCVERYSHVMHIVSDVEGVLRKDKDIYDLIKAVFPAGTVTGAPKVRAMQLIDELENVRRGPYAGCVGYISFSGNTDMCITIRTIVMKGDTAFIQAGAGIVLDSKPEKEYEETLNKAKAMFKAVEFAERGLE
ncbi:MAG: anthranilate synthase component I [Candidatus Omnitrophica bacterium]|nr:anthranilate synthase component I [Candidatus Omnitrophota bacterium]